MNLKQWLLSLTALLMGAILFALYRWNSLWFPPLRTFVRTNFEELQTWAALIALVPLVLGALAWAWNQWSRTNPSPEEPGADGHKPRIIESSIATRYTIPPPPHEFTGRVTELNKLIESRGWRSLVRRLWSRASRRHRSDSPRLLGLMGMGGVGKTTLALKVAQHLRNDYPDAHLFLDMRGTREQPRTPVETMTEVIRAFHPEAKLPEDQALLRSFYLSTLRDKRVLLLLDDVKDREQVEPLLPPASCAVIVTSRQYFTLPNLQPLRLGTLSPADARELLRKIVPFIKEAEAKQLTELCGNLPLALTLAGNAIAAHPDLTPTEYARLLQDEQRRLDLVEASITLSYNLLHETQQQRWLTLAVFPATFDRSAVAAVWNMETENETRVDDTAETLSTLVRYSLVEWLEAERRYRLHDLARLFANARLADDKRDAAQRRHAAHFLKVLSDSQELYEKGGEAVNQALALFDIERPNIQAGQAWAASRAAHNDTAARLCSRYPNRGIRLLLLRLHSREQIQWLNQALAAALQLKDRISEVSTLGNLGLAHTNLGKVPQAIDYYQRVLAIAREIGHRRYEGRALGNLGNAYAALDEVRLAIDYHQQNLVIARDIGDRRGESSALGNLGRAYATLREVRLAIDYHQQALAIAREIGHRLYEGRALGNLGNAYAALGKVPMAIDYHQQSLVIARQIGDRRGESSALGNLGLAYTALGKVRQAIGYYQQQLTITREIGDRDGEGNALGNLGNAYAAFGKGRLAIGYYQQRIAIAREIGDRGGEGNALFHMSLALDALGERERAIQFARTALQIYEQIEDPHTEKVRRALAAWCGEEPPS